MNRFLDAQTNIYESALKEIKRGEKSSHWMWYIFPQYKGLGQSLTSQKLMRVNTLTFYLQNIVRHLIKLEVILGFCQILNGKIIMDHEMFHIFFESLANE